MSRPEETDESAASPDASEAPPDEAAETAEPEAELDPEAVDAAADAALAATAEAGDEAAGEGEKAEKASAARKGPAGRTDGRIRRVLVVEDSPPLRRMIEKLLSADGFEVQVAENGEVAYKKLTTTETPFDLMLLDIMMPGLDGIQLMAKLKKEEVEAIPPFVICSSRSDRETIQLVGRLGAAGYILKPFKTETVIGKVHEALGIDAG